MPCQGNQSEVFFDFEDEVVIAKNKIVGRAFFLSHLFKVCFNGNWAQIYDLTVFS